MSSITPNMSLIKWNEGGDPYDHTQLSANFQKIDEHNHTVEKGARLPGSALENEAINTAQIKDAAVTNAKLSGGIGLDKIETGVVASLGDFKLWWRPNLSTEVPGSGWIIAAGQSLSAEHHDFAGGGTIVLPNLLKKFPMGVEIEEIGNTGGAATINLSHSHAVNPHQHTVAGHNHSINFESGLALLTALQISQDPEGHAWVHADDNPNGQHRHSVIGSTSSTGLTTEAAGGTTDSRLSSTQSITPPFVGLLPMIKVKNS